MIIINADDWGRSRLETDAAMACFVKGKIASASAMVFMEDSERAASLAKEVGIDVGLHLNLSQNFTGNVANVVLKRHHERIVRFLTSHKYTMLVYHPVLRDQFWYVYWAQIEEFIRLYGHSPSHIDGHHHKHLCSNMLLANIIPDGEKVRRSFSFFAGQKSCLNRIYRHLVDNRLARKYVVTDYFFSLSQSLNPERSERIRHLAAACTVELMTHPVNAEEFAFLMSDACQALLAGIDVGNYSLI